MTRTHKSSAGEPSQITQSITTMLTDCWYSVVQLHKLAKEVEEDMRTRKKRSSERFLAEETTAPYGTIVDESFPPLGTRRARSKLTYRNPENPRQTWSGRGNQPAWIKEVLKSGVTLEELQVK